MHVIMKGMYLEKEKVIEMENKIEMMSKKNLD